MWSASAVSAGTSNGCSNNRGACEHLCLPRPGGLYTCACATGFKLSVDNRICAPYQSYVVISMLSALKGFSLEGADHSEAMVPVAGRGGCCSDVNVLFSLFVSTGENNTTSMPMFMFNQVNLSGCVA